MMSNSDVKLEIIYKTLQRFRGVYFFAKNTNKM